jgi:hypothetical protein
MISRSGGLRTLRGKHHLSMPEQMLDAAIALAKRLEKVV